MMNATLTSNQFYAGLNRRFDKRAAKLRKMGFKASTFEIPGTRQTYGVFLRGQPGRMESVLTSLVMNATNRVFNDELARLRR